MSDILQMLGIQVGIGIVGGFLIGYAVKKVVKLVILLLVMFLVALIYLSLNEVVGVDYATVWHLMADLLGLAGSAISWFVSLLSLLPFVGSLVFGFLIGFILG
jgi:uncharacterized membrane protein (Fun14 family)